MKLDLAPIGLIHSSRLAAPPPRRERWQCFRRAPLACANHESDKCSPCPLELPAGLVEDQKHHSHSKEYR